MFVLVYTPHGVLSQKQTESVGSPHRETRQTKGVATLGRNEEDQPPPSGLRGSNLGAKETLWGGGKGILDETWSRKGAKLAKVWEGFPQK